ncbi:MAG: UDP-N-acetylglucosamine diphosphorylase/glucosamine-1-phosphate N-acetyltransferase [Gammaproteobacteria bacterium RIFCSPHIGHO2_12_FULL_35_23]|nr:MAG: UDP-N-acetylglucosamine diphosphorylase/glucosamine-1-phosphate N-acetyltransferase [Gammaproteobacteria bacterium RIFCSPHIGHO2_12_FULL_35_23]
MNISIVILAAGEGTRMRSQLPKVLQRLAGKPLLAHVIETVMQISKAITVVYGHGGEQVKQALAAYDVNWVEQKQQLGTGHAVLQALPTVTHDKVLVLYGDVPLISVTTLKNLIAQTPEKGIGWLTAKVKKPSGLGRIIRDAANNPVAIVEEKDASAAQQAITEINTGICLLPVKNLKTWLPNLKNKNVQGEYYLTDVFAMAIAEKLPIITLNPTVNHEIQGVNNKIELAKLERTYQMHSANLLLESGVTLIDPKRFDLRGELTVGKDVIIDVNVVIEGSVKIGANCYLGPNVYVKNSSLADNVRVEANSHIEGASVATDCVIGPFARLRPETILHAKAKVGNFVEVKKSSIGEGSKVNHLTYIGDATIGAKVNVGAGTVTCNYDGVNKYHTIIEEGAFIGTNNSLIAPVVIGKNATTGAGSAINKNVPEGELAIGRAKQVNISGWKRPQKIEKAKN